MKKQLIILAATALLSIMANATPNDSFIGSITNTVGVRSSSFAQSAPNYNNVDFDNRPAASPSGTASSNTTSDCRYLDQWAISFVVANASKTKMLRDLVCTLEKPLNPYQKLALCIESGDYRQLRYYISTLPLDDNGKPQEAACPVGGSSKVLGIK